MSGGAGRSPLPIIVCSAPRPCFRPTDPQAGPTKSDGDRVSNYHGLKHPAIDPPGPDATYARGHGSAALPESAVKKIPLALVWLVPIVAVPLLVYSLMPFWTK
jgi:hypothetical protein